MSESIAHFQMATQTQDEMSIKTVRLVAVVLIRRTILKTTIHTVEILEVVPFVWGMIVGGPLFVWGYVGPAEIGGVVRVRSINWI
jgi:hypothetical protein